MRRLRTPSIHLLNIGTNMSHSPTVFGKTRLENKHKHQLITVFISTLKQNLEEFAGVLKRSCSVGYNETNASADSDDPSGELCMQPVTCCLSVSKQVKGELIIPAG